MNYGKQLKTDSECSQFDIKVNQSAGDVIKLLYKIVTIKPEEPRIE